MSHLHDIAFVEIGLIMFRYSRENVLPLFRPIVIEHIITVTSHFIVGLQWKKNKRDHETHTNEYNREEMFV
jgi:hypothetical protein